MLSFPFGTLSGPFELAIAVGMLTLALMMTFVGSRLKWLSFLVTGLVVAFTAAQVGAEYFGPPGAVVSFVIGFVTGSAFAAFYAPAGMGLSVGFASYSVSLTLISVSVVAPMVGLVGFAYGFLLTDFLLPEVSAVVGAFLLFDAFLLAGVPPVETLLLCVGLSSAGACTQVYLARKAKNLFGQANSYRARRLQSQSSQS